MRCDKVRAERIKPIGVDVANILILEDDLVFAGLVASNLNKAGHSVQIASDGATALAFARDQRFDVLLVDVYIKVAGQYSADGGLLLTTRVRTQSLETPFATPRDVFIIAMSGAIYQLGDRHILTTAQSLGADEILPKPFPPKDLIDLIKMHEAGQRSPTPS